MLLILKEAKIFQIKRHERATKSVIPEVWLTLLNVLTCASSVYFLLQPTLQFANCQALTPTYVFPGTQKRAVQQQQPQHRSHYNTIHVDPLPAPRKRSTSGVEVASAQSAPDEWPFIKSLQSARQSSFNFVDRYNEAHKLEQQQSKHNPRALDLPEQDVSPRAGSEEQQMASPSEQSTQMPTTTTTSSTTTTANSPATASAPPDEGGMRASPGASPKEDAGEQDIAQEQPTTTIRPLVSAEQAAGTVRPPDPLFSPDFHSSIQRAVDRIIKMTSEAAAKVSTEVPAPKSNLRASLSLNVLLKNFGVHNLTNLDQILLKSSLKNDTRSGDGKLKRPAPKDSPVMSSLSGGDSDAPLVSINGTHELSSGSTSDENETDQSAECKIEYTMKHVNISLMNDSKRDYTCDYIIDRKMSANQKLASTSMASVCKLNIRSSFFSDQIEETTQPDGQDQPESNTCNGTYLVVDRMRFCYLRESERNQLRPLDRVFDFPAELDSFDIKMVHKQRKAQATAEDKDMDSDSEIHLEIKPISDDECRTKAGFDMDAANLVRPMTGVEYDPSPDPPTASTPSTTKPVPARETKPAPQSAPEDKLEPRAEPSAGTTVAPLSPRRGSVILSMNNPTRRKFIVKIPHDKQPHPLNRIRTSQSFDVNSSPRLQYTATGLATAEEAGSGQSRQQTSLTPAAAGKKPAASTGGLCDKFEHVATVGQLTSPDYPHYYPAGVNCSLVIRQASPAFCKVLLQFRDFDLINDAPPARSSDCLDDYLRIGETRYCNRYAMIGHKMTLDFSAGQEASQSGSYRLVLTFRSDHMRSGRGFLIKYQQLACDSPAPDEPATRHHSSPKSVATKLIGDLLIQSHAHTVAPPMQQPDFSLALKTTPSAAETSKPAPSADKSRKPASPETGHRDAASEASKRGRAAPDQVNATSNHLMSMASTTSSFAASQPTQTADCSQVNSEMSFVLKSPGFPNQYANNLQCLIYVRPNNSQVCYLELTFLKFDLEADADCRYDFLEINNVRLCGSLKDVDHHRTTRIYQFNESLKLIKFQSDELAAKSGFLIKVDQLECAPSGAILRQGRAMGAERQPPVDSNRKGALTTSVTASSSNSTTFAYDSLLSSAERVNPPASASSGLQARPKSAGDSVPKPYVCDDILQGREVTIKSPLWPESYSDNEAIGMCRYTIIRHTTGRNRICQLELRFVNLRLGVSDCIDVDGYEVLCGFNTRNMVKYYPFEHQSHLTVTFFTGAGKVSRSLDDVPARIPLRFMILAKQHECVDGFLAPQYDFNGHYNTTNLLYSNTPRYVNKTYNLLAPAPAPADSSGGSTGPGADYSSTLSQQRPKTAAEAVSLASNDSSTLKYDHLTDSKPANEVRPTLLYTLANSNLQANKTADGCPDGSIVQTADQLFSAHYPLSYRNNVHCAIQIARKSDKFCHLELEMLEVDLESRSKLCEADYIQVNHGERYCDMEQVERRLGPKRLLTVPFERLADHKVTVLFHSDRMASRRGFLIRQRQVECARAAIGELVAPDSIKTQRVDESEMKLIDRVPLAANSQRPSSQQQVAAGEERCLVQHAQYNGILSSSSLLARLRSGPQLRNECEIRIKLLPGFCHLQLTFNEFELSPRYKEFCIDSLRLNGVEYCGAELKNASRVIGINEASQRSVSIRYAVSQLQLASSSSTPYGFRAVFKQLECSPEPLGQLESPSFNTRPAPTKPQQVALGQQPAPARPAPPVLSAGEEPNPHVEFKEISLASEFFEMNSLRLSKSTDSYDPNMFVIYRIKKSAANVCKLRLMFYRFDLEPSPGCKRDFLDINSQDRLCGKLGKAEDTRRDYQWPGERDFLVSFVSDASIQREGFLVFGQQLQANCTEQQVAQPAKPGVPPQSAAFDEETTTAAPALRRREEPDSRQPQQQAMKQLAKPPVPASEESSGCHKLFYESSFQLASPNWPARYGPRASCHYLIHKAQPDVCSVTFNVLSMILDTEDSEAGGSTCDPARQDHLDIDGQLLCGFISKPRPVTVHFGRRLFLSAKFGSPATSGFGFFIEVKQNRCEPASDVGSPVASSAAPPVAEEPAKGRPDERPSAEAGCDLLLKEEVSLVESEMFPRHYAHNQDCLYALRRTNQSVCAIDVVLNHFELEERNNSTGVCENDYLEIDYTRLCGSYPAKHKLRFNYFQEELDKLIRFHSDASLSRPGFSLSIRQVSDCALASAPAQQPQKDPKSAPPASAAGEPDELISYLPDSSTSQSSTTESSPAQVQSRNSSADSEALREVSTLCQLVYHSERQYLTSPNYNEHRRSYSNNMDCLYKIVAKSYDFCSLKLVLLDVDLEASSECHNDYLLIDNQRYCGSSATGAQQGSKPVLEVQFADTLPREIHLLYHTNGHGNEGRGFRLFYEQQPCSQMDQQSFKLQNGDLRLGAPASPTSSAQRQARRLHFGQLSYPANYVSEPVRRDSAERHHQPQQQRLERTAEVAPRQLESESWRETRSSQPRAPPRTANETAMDLEEQHDDLTLRKEIVVVKSTSISS